MLLPPVIKIQNKHALQIAEVVIKHWNALVLPTETCYGIACDATNPAAVRSVYRAKQRKQSKQITILVSSLEMAKKYLQLTSLAITLSKKRHPGPLTLVVRRKKGSKLARNLSRSTVGFRIPSNEFCLELLKRCKVPLTATSANISGEPVVYSCNQLSEDLLKNVDLVINAGHLPARKPSTIVDCTGTKPKVIRQGEVKI